MTKPRVAVLVPSTDSVLEQELPQMLAGRASVHTTRMRLPGVHRDGLAAMEDHALEAVGLLADINPHVTVFGCTSGSFFKGAEHERWLARRLARLVGGPVVTTAWAVGLALQSRGKVVRVRTPYDDFLTEAEAAYLNAAGLQVSSAVGLGLTVDDDIAAVTPERVLALAQGNDPSDVLLLSCTNMPTLGLLDLIAATAGMPVVSSNSATAEAVAKVLTGELAALAMP